MVSNFDIQDLLDVIEGKVATTESRNESEIYFDDNGVVDGKDWVDDRLVYWHYLKWCIKLKRVPISRLLFNKGAQKRFKRHTSRSKCYFKLDKSIFAVSHDEWKEIVDDYNLEKSRKKWLKEQKKKKKNRAKEARRKNKERQEEMDPQIPDSLNSFSQE